MSCCQVISTQVLIISNESNMYTHNNHTAPHTANKADSTNCIYYGVVIVVAININSFYHGRALHCYSMSNLELSLVLHVWGRYIYFKEVMYPRKYFTLNFLWMKYFLSNNFRTTVSSYPMLLFIVCVCLEWNRAMWWTGCLTHMIFIVTLDDQVIALLGWSRRD